MASVQHTAPRAAGRTLRRQHEQQRQWQQEQASPYADMGRELPEKQHQTRHSASPVPPADGYDAGQ